MTTVAATKRSPGSVWLAFLGSMNLAITLLVAVAIASVIGTVLQQGETSQNYIIKFGPYWHDIFKLLGLNDVYSAFWFLLILGFLLVSTSVCIYRNTPSILRDMRQYRLSVGRNSLRAFHHQHEINTALDSTHAITSIETMLQRHGYRTRCKQHDGHTVVAAMKGSASRLGYLCTHAAIVIICLGGLIDGNLPLKLSEMTGKVKVETRDIPASQVSTQSVLAADNASFRASVTVPEKSIVDLAFINMGDGYLVQKLPFKIELKEFRVEYYKSGQPKSFESDLVLHDDALDKPLEKTIAVNHPLVYKNYAIYQASFGDGGSTLRMRAWPLTVSDKKPFEVEGRVNQHIEIKSSQGPLTMELGNFRLFNINPVDPEKTGKKFNNFGPSFEFKLRRPNGIAREYTNYMAPVDQDGRMFFISGMRESVADPFRYLYIPADNKFSMDRFLKFHAALLNEETVSDIAARTALDTLESAGLPTDKMKKEITSSMLRLNKMFLAGGYDAVSRYIEETVPKEKQQNVAAAFLRILHNLLVNVFLSVLEAEGVDTTQPIGDKDSQFFDDALNAIAAIGFYDAPFYLQLYSFDHVEASGLQITRAPGKNIVYTGCVLLIIGVFLMFYVPHRRVWAWISTADGQTSVLLAGSSHRNPLDFNDEFERISKTAVNVLDNHR